MGVSVLRIAACAGVLVGGLMLGNTTAGFAVADPGGASDRYSDEQSSKGVNNNHPSLSHLIHRIISEHRRPHQNGARSAPQAKIGSEPDSSFIASEPTASTFADVNEEPAPDPELAPDNERGAETTGSDTTGSDSGAGGDGVDPGADPGGSDYTDNAVVTDDTVVAAEPAPDTQQSEIDTVEYPFLYYLLEVRRGGGGWWNATRIISRRQEESSEPTPEPEPQIAPAFRGPAPEAPAPEPVLDASGGVAGGGSDYQATGFGVAPVLSAPIVAAPVLPPAAARFPAFPPPATSAPGLGSAAARGTPSAPGSTAEGARTAGPQEQTPVGTVKAMSGQAPRQGYTDYLGRPGLPQLAGAALPGVAGILVMTLGGAVIGYRQASAGRMIRASGAARYLP